MTLALQTMPIGDLLLHFAEILNKTRQGPVLLQDRNQPAVVLVDPTLWAQMTQLLAAPLQINGHTMPSQLLTLARQAQTQADWTTDEELTQQIARKQANTGATCGV